MSEKSNKIVIKWPKKIKFLCARRVWLCDGAALPRIPDLTGLGAKSVERRPKQAQKYIYGCFLG
jgi:hypothetical protein